MKRFLSMFLLFCLVLSLAGCGNTVTESVKETVPLKYQPPVFMSDNAAENRVYHIQQFEKHLTIFQEMPYEGWTAQVNPEGFGEYLENFNVVLQEDTELNRKFLEWAISIVPEVRMKVADDADCPDEILVHMAIHEPYHIIKLRALENILSQDDFPSEHLMEMALSESSSARYFVLLHANRTNEMVQLLIDDSSQSIAEEAIYILENTSTSE